MPAFYMFSAKFMACTEEAKAAMTGDMIKSATDPEVKATKKADLDAKFATCDADGDGRHNKDEMKAFGKMQFDELNAKHGAEFNFTDEEMETRYTIYNVYSEGEGISREDYDKIGEVFRACSAKAQAAHAAAQ